MLGFVFKARHFLYNSRKTINFEELVRNKILVVKDQSGLLFSSDVIFSPSL